MWSELQVSLRIKSRWLSTVYLTIEDDRQLFLDLVVSKLPPQLVVIALVDHQKGWVHRVLPWTKAPFWAPFLKSRLQIQRWIRRRKDKEEDKKTKTTTKTHLCRAVKSMRSLSQAVLWLHLLLWPQLIGLIWLWILFWAILALFWHHPILPENFLLQICLAEANIQINGKPCADYLNPNKHMYFNFKRTWELPNASQSAQRPSWLPIVWKALSPVQKIKIEIRLHCGMENESSSFQY